MTSIRLLQSSDLHDVLAWRNHPNVRRFMFTQHEIRPEEHQQWFEKVRQDSTRRLLIVEDGKAPLGFVQLSNVEVGGVAGWGFYACPEAPKGSGRKLGQVALKYAFEHERLHKLCGQAIETNIASIAFHKSLGFQEEGVLREHRKIAECYYNLVCFGLLHHEWSQDNALKDN